MKELDKKDCVILNLLQEDCRMSLTDISKRVGLSIDSVKKRINRMIKDNIFFSKVQLRPRNFGFCNIVDVRIKLHNYSKDDYETFRSYLKKNPHISEIFSISGHWDISIVIIAKDALHLGRITREIRNDFNSIIESWTESLTTGVCKFENYDMVELMDHDKQESKRGLK